MDRSNSHEDRLDKVKMLESTQSQPKGGVRARLQAGIIVDKYELVEEVASGGMSVIFKAQDIALKRPVAIKFLLTDELDGAEFAARFKQEARALATLEHPNIVKVHDSGVTADGDPYIVMNYLNGSDLAHALASDGTLSLGRWLAIMIQACSALEHAHAKGIIHRDIKPSNFVLAQESNHELLKLIDFGIAKDLADETGLTKTGSAFGSPLYMSPEQCAGAKIDERSDIYSLGCVMYEALAGKAPLVGDNSLSTMQKHINDAPEPLSKMLPKSFGNDNKVKSLNSIVMKCLEKNSENRYQKMSEVKEDLSSLLQGEKPSLRLSLVGKKRQIVISALIGLFCAAVALVMFQFTKFVQSNMVAAPTNSPVAQTSSLTSPSTTQTVVGSSNKESAALAERGEMSVGERQITSLMLSCKHAAKSGDWKLVKELATRALPICAQEGNPPAMVGWVYWHLAHAEDKLEDYPAAKRDYLSSIKAVSGRPENSCKDWEFQSLMGLGKMAAINKEYDQSVAYYGQAYKSNETREPNWKRPNMEENQRKKHKAVCMAQLGEVYFLQKDYARARTYLNAALTVLPGNVDVLRIVKRLPPAYRSN